MAADLESADESADQAVVNDYDSFAEAYAAETESSLINGYYTRPAILDLVGDVAGRQILDIGCGAGPLLESLRDRGAIVTGADSSTKLVLHYLEDWSAPLAELRRVLRPGGRLIIAVNHPIIYRLLNPKADYFAVTRWSDEYTFSGQPAVLTYWHRPLHAMTDAFTAAGFRTAVISEPPAAPGASERFPDEMAKFPSGAFLSFLFFVLEAV